MRVRCAHNREGQIFDIFGPPKSGWGVGPAPGFAVLQLGLVWQAKQAVAAKKAAEEAEKVPSPPHWMHSVSVALRATHAHALSGNNVIIQT